MAQRQQVILECDLDPEGERRQAETMTFWNSQGTRHEIEVCEEHRKDIEEVLEALDSFTVHARRIGPNTPAQRGGAPATGRRRARGGSDGTSPDPKVVREWAKSQGITVNERGRLSQEVLQQYLAATG